MAGSAQRSAFNETPGFKLERGSSFEAGGGSRRTASAKLTRRQIVTDISEALAVIETESATETEPRRDEMTASAVEGMLHTLDPHSHFFGRSEWKALNDDYNNQYVGIGVSIITRVKGGEVGTFVVSTVPGSPAASAGLRYGDRILNVNGADVKTRNSIYVSEKLRGADGTKLNVTLERASGGSETVSVTRINLPQPTVTASFMLDDEVGYVGLTHGFSFETAEEVRAAVAKLSAEGMHSLVLDLRGNPGGILAQSIKVAEQFLPSGSVIVTQRGRTPNDTITWRSKDTPKTLVPMVLLIDGETASASEVLAGAMQDNDRALIVGGRTFGKGLVQNVLDLPDETGLTLTAAQYYTPAGRSIQRDYSDGSFYNYFNHKNKIADIDKPQYVAKTITGRRVYGGDGIAPDIAAETPLISRQAEDAVAFFAASYAGGANVSDDELLAAFHKFTGVTSGHDPNLLRSLRIATATAAKGASAGNRVRIMNDPAVAAAMKEMENSRALFAKARGLGNQR